MLQQQKPREGIMGLRSYHLALAIGIMLASAPVAAETTTAEEVLAPLVAMPVAQPRPAFAADAKQHLAYDLVLLNLAGTPVALKKVEALDDASGAVLYTLEGDGLAQMFKPNGGGKGTEVPGGGSGILFLDVALPKDASVPKALKHRFAIEVAKPDAGGDEGSDRDPAPAPKQELVFTTDALAIGPGAIVVAPPLKGKRWVVGGGCCAPPSYHRGATLPINGAIASRSASPSTSCS
jgi:hypothetical protein